MKAFLVGFVAGAVALYAALWWTEGLAPPRFAPVRVAHPRAPEPTSAAPASPVPASPEARPSRSPGESTDDRLGALFASPADLGTAPAAATDLATLAARDLAFPVDGFDRARLLDDFADRRGDRVHEAIDIPAPRGTPVRAVDDGTVRKLFVSRAGGNTVYQFDRDGAYCYYYAHLDAYAPGLREGQAVTRGQLLGTVGTSGNSPPDRPHLHFTIFKLGAEGNWWEGTAVNPFPLWALK